MSPTYQLAKTLNQIVTPYLPNKYSLKSTDDFLDLLNSIQCKGILASLDVESLFTNVPSDETIQIILENAYNHDNIPPPKMPNEILKQLWNSAQRKLLFVPLKATFSFKLKV